MKTKFIIVATLFILTPFVLGLALLKLENGATTDKRTRFIEDTRANNTGIVHERVKVDWSFCPDWNYKPLFMHEKEYLVFVFHYQNMGDRMMHLMPSYACYSPQSRSYSANEEISMYIEDKVEDELKIKDETPIAYGVYPDSVKHDIVTFEKSRSLEEFYVDVDLFRDAVLRLYYRKEGGVWKNHANKMESIYKGRG